MLAPIVNAILHLGVAAMPGNMTMQFIDRMISGAFIFGYLAPTQAALADMSSWIKATKYKHKWIFI